VAARGTIDCSLLRVNGGVQRLVGQLIADTDVILYAISGMLQARESGSARRWDGRERWRGGFKALMLLQGLAVHRGDGVDLSPTCSKAESLDINLPARACWTSQKVCNAFDHGIIKVGKDLQDRQVQPLRGQSYGDRVGSCLLLSCHYQSLVQMPALRPGSSLHHVGFVALWSKKRPPRSWSVHGDSSFLVPVSRWVLRRGFSPSCFCQGRFCSETNAFLRAYFI